MIQARRRELDAPALNVGKPCVEESVQIRALDIDVETRACLLLVETTRRAHVTGGARGRDDAASLKQRLRKRRGNGVGVRLIENSVDCRAASILVHVRVARVNAELRQTTRAR